jgi:hypothetical protein
MVEELVDCPILAVYVNSLGVRISTGRQKDRGSRAFTEQGN